LAHNLRRVRELAPRSKVMAIIKANGYGHGMVRVARALGGADGFGVASLEEAMCLRQAGVTHRILLLEGFFSTSELEMIQEHRLDVVLHHPSQLEALAQTRIVRPLQVWLKCDTGMNRLGFPIEHLRHWWERVQALPQVAPPVRLMTHLASADEPDKPQTCEQLGLFFPQVAGLNAELSIANSAGVLAWHESHVDWVRPGIMLYGISPFPLQSAEEYGLRPAMTMRTALIAVNQIESGARVGYGGTWTCPQRMPVGVAAIGYGDGYPRHAEPGTPVLVNGQRSALIGRVSMDMITLDLRSQPRARPGDPVILWGEGLPVEEVARHAGTIPYELVCRTTSRVAMVESQ
jgi:alanine racemase